MSRPTPKSKKTGSGRLIIELLLVVAMLCSCGGWIRVIPSVGTYLQTNQESLVKAAESTAAYFVVENSIDPSTVSVTLDPSSGAIAGSNEQQIVAAALKVLIPAHLLLGFAQIESSMCGNLGTGIAIDEVNKRLNAADLRERGWWQANVEALKAISNGLGVPIQDIKGSMGAGAISCLQVMPSNWVALHCGDYRSTFDAAVCSGRYLNAHGFQTDQKKAFGSYNPGAGQPYVDSVLNAAEVWKEKISSISIADLDIPTTTDIGQPKEPKLPLNLITLGTVYTEFVLLYTSGDPMVIEQSQAPGESGPIPIAGTFVYPYRGSSVVLTTAYWTAIYDIKGNFVINHPGVDLSNNRSDPIVAVADGKVVYAKNLPLSDQKSVAWWISGETVFLRSETTDGKALCTIYGHGVPGTMKVTLGQTIHAGDELFLAGQSGNSTGIHLHFAAKVGGTGDYCDGGQWINPMNLFASNN